MKLFKKVFKSLFKIVLVMSIAVSITATDIFLKIEYLLLKLKSKLYPKPYITKEEHLNQLREEYKKDNSGKEVDMD